MFWTKKMVRKMKKILFSLLFCICGALVSAQTAAKLSDIIYAERATYGQTCYIAAAAAGFIGDDASYEEAFSAIKERGFIRSKTATPDTPITMKHIASIFSLTWDVQESVMSVLTRQPRYQFRQLKAYGVIPAIFGPESAASGRDMLGVASKCASLFGGGDAL